MAEVPWMLPIGEATNGQEALTLIDGLKPDLVFLDVRMPEMSGLEVATQMQHQPSIVFTTAYDQYAVSAFELEALDYLLKPFSRKRFLKTLERIRHRLDQATPPPLAAQLDQLTGNQPYLENIFVRQGSRILPLCLQDVIHFQACENYIQLFTKTESHLIHLPMAELIEKLDPSAFLRIHRSHIINLHHIQNMEIYDERRLIVSLSHGEKVLASRSGSKILKKQIFS